MRWRKAVKRETLRSVRGRTYGYAAVMVIDRSLVWPVLPHDVAHLCGERAQALLSEWTNNAFTVMFAAALADAKVSGDKPRIGVAAMASVLLSLRMIGVEDTTACKEVLRRALARAAELLNSAEVWQQIETEAAALPAGGVEPARLLLNCYDLLHNLSLGLGETCLPEVAEMFNRDFRHGFDVTCLPEVAERFNRDFRV